MVLGQGSVWGWIWWAAIFFLILLRHRDNIRRLISGQERRLGQKAIEATE